MWWGGVGCGGVVVVVVVERGCPSCTQRRHGARAGVSTARAAGAQGSGEKSWGQGPTGLTVIKRHPKAPSEERDLTNIPL